MLVKFISFIIMEMPVIMILLCLVRCEIIYLEISDE